MRQSAQNSKPARPVEGKGLKNVFEPGRQPFQVSDVLPSDPRPPLKDSASTTFGRVCNFRKMDENPLICAFNTYFALVAT